MLVDRSVTNRFVPFYRHASAVDVGGGTILKILETRIARFLTLSATATQRRASSYLSIACLETKMEEATNAVLGSSR